MIRTGDFYGEDYQGREGDDMVTVASHCSRFSRRHDFDTFSMSTYQSCENCRHLSSEGRCSCGAQNSIFPME